tara:strand:+ start:68 stop:247 length:180 start_codon:yes stop_codon:yes gene_type:complete
MAKFDVKTLLPTVDVIMDFLEDNEHFKPIFKKLNTDQKLDLMEDLTSVVIKIRLDNLLN